MRFQLQYVALCLLVLFFIGCRQGYKADHEFRVVKGTVMFNGAPVAGATVAFSPMDNDGLAAGGTTDASGSYTLTADNSLVLGAGTKPGKYKVTVKLLDDGGAAQAHLDFKAGKITMEEFTQRPDAFKPSKVKHLLPEIYADPTTSPLEMIVENKKVNVIDLNVEGKKM